MKDLKPNARKPDGGKVSTECRHLAAQNLPRFEIITSIQKVRGQSQDRAGVLGVLSLTKSAVDGERGAGHVARGRPGQQQERAVQVVGWPKWPTGILRAIIFSPGGDWKNAWFIGVSI